MRWSRYGIKFESLKQHYIGNEEAYLRSSGEIANIISEILFSEIPSTVKSAFANKKLVVLYQKDSASDAMFFPPGTLRKSEDEEWIISLNPSLISTPNYLRIVAHEFFHALHHAVNPEEADWVREGLAQLFEHQLYKGFNQTHIHSALTKSDFSLESTFNYDHYFPEKYGNTFLYFYYLSSQCGQQGNLLWSFVTSGKTGREGIDFVLKNLHSELAQCSGFQESAEAFSLAKLVNAYSGFKQSTSTYLLTSIHKLPVDSLEAKYLADPIFFWKSLTPYRPIKLSKKAALMLLKSSPSNVVWWGLERDYPQRTKKLMPSEIQGLSQEWDLGLIIH